MAEEKLSTAESLRATRTYGQVRCHNPSCTSRITPAPGTTQVKCPVCGSEWRIFWIKAGFPRIKGPVWETSQRLANERLASLAEQKEPKKEGK
ncbi:MAG: hypothetical protein A4E58_00676 [Syntrophorhabdus sp. PtaB.Bin006]|nr:MAG: hypothetical protein A4E58_00676 [Syntrophorhabdus sp. PtaB.Bin006]